MAKRRRIRGCARYPCQDMSTEQADKLVEEFSLGLLTLAYEFSHYFPGLLESHKPDRHWTLSFLPERRRLDGLAEAEDLKLVFNFR